MKIFLNIIQCMYKAGPVGLIYSNLRTVSCFWNELIINVCYYIYFAFNDNEV